MPISKVDKGLRSRRSVPYDVKRVGDPKCDQVFLRALASAPSVPLVIEPTSHCRLLEEIVVSAACDAYPFEKVRRKRPRISDVTLKLLNDRNKVLCDFQKRVKSLHNNALFVVFKFWACRRFVRFSPLWGLGSPSILKKYCSLHAQLWYHNRHVSAYLEMDKLAMFDLKADAIEKILNDATDISAIHSHIKTLKHYSKKASQKTLRVDRGDGKASSSKHEEKLVFRAHFSEQLGGCGDTFARLHSATLDSLTESVSSRKGIGVTGVLPGVSSLARCFRSASMGAGGEDRIRGALPRRFPRAFACLYFPLVFKSSCLLSPPFTMAWWSFAGIV